VLPAAYRHRPGLRPPNAAVSEDEARQVYNEDLVDLSPSELEHAIWLVTRTAARDPRAFLWRGLEHITARQYADERIAACRELLRPSTPPRPPRRGPRAKPWT